jgi:cholesterol transport system auxiliary component
VTGPSAALRTVPLLCLCLSGCTGLFHSTATPEQTYYLRAPSAASTAAGAADAAPATPPAAASLRVGRPVAAPGLDTPHIMLLQADHRMNFYTGSRWPAPVPDVLEALAAETLHASGAWASIEYSSSPFPSEYLLQITVRRFEADYTAGGSAPVVYVVLDCVIGRREGREVIATFTASGSSTAAANHMSDVVAAFETATDTALSTLSQQATQAVRSDTLRATQNEADPAPSIRR